MARCPVRRNGSALAALVAVALLSGAAAAAPAAHKVTVTAGLVGDKEHAEAYMKANEPFAREVLPETIRDCALANPPHGAASFALDITVGQGGKATAVKAKPTTDFTSCVAEATKSHTFAEPPKVPSEIYVEVEITP